MGFVDGKKEPLTSDLVERGKITKKLLFRSDEGEVSFLELGIDAKIRRHSNPKSNVRYYNVNTGKLESEVKAGENHSLVNPTGKQLRVIAVEEFVK